MSLTQDIDFEIKDSPLNGKGVFAKRQIDNGEVVFTWNPKVLTKGEASKLPTDEQKRAIG